MLCISPGLGEPSQGPHFGETALRSCGRSWKMHTASLSSSTAASRSTAAGTPQTTLWVLRVCVCVPRGLGLQIRICLLISCDDCLPGHGGGDSSPQAATGLLGDIRLAVHLSKTSATQWNVRALGLVAKAPSFSRILLQAGVLSWSTVTQRSLSEDLRN